MTPIQVGASLAKEKMQGMLHDDEGENISQLNPYYCELTAQYWAWKNLDADYYGFFHYRRYFSFHQVQDTYDCWGNLVADFIDNSIVEKYGLDEETIQSVVEKYDVVLPEYKDIRKMPNMGSNLREQYLGSGYLHQSDLELLEKILANQCPEYLPYAKKYFEGHYTWLNNMFIMRRDIFCSYCEWLFAILKEYMDRADMSDYSVEALRTPGHLAERLLNIYCLRLKDVGNYRFGELQTVGFAYTDPQPQIDPAFDKKNVAIALSANDFYVPYLGALMCSMRAHFSAEQNYDLLVMQKDISPAHQKQLQGLFAEYPNVSLRFVNIRRYEQRFSHLFLRGHFVIETYFRLLMPELFPTYDKILYIDSDLIVLDDLAKLYNTDIHGYLLAACRDADTAGLYNGFEPQKKAYMDNILKIKKPYEYFQAGVILFNLDEFRKQYTTDQMLNFALSYKWELLDQDVLNYLAQGKVKFLPMNWNVMMDWRGIRISEIISRAPKYLRDEYMKAREDAKIVHYAGPDKPWHQPGSDMADKFWQYARISPWYEVILARLSEQIANSMRPAPLSVRMRNKTKAAIKAVLMPPVNLIFPKYTQRRENLKKVWKKVKHMVKD